MVINTPEWKFKASIARNATFEGWLGPKNFSNLGKKWQKTGYFQEFIARNAAFEGWLGPKFFSNW